MTVGSGVITGVSISHADASVEQLESAAETGQRGTVATLLDQQGVEEAFVLQTCNRVEGYVVTSDYETGQAALGVITDGVHSDCVVEMDHEESLRHLLRVAAGLESLVLGEDQILGQVSSAYEDARGVGGIGPLLEDGVTKAIHVGERARTETGINEGVVSLASAAVQLASEQRALESGTGLVVGAGEMGALAVKSLGEHVERLLVANRTVPHASHLAEQADTEASAIALDALAVAVAEADVVVSATGSSGPVIDRDALADAGETFVVDIAQPRDVAPAADDLENVTVYDLDALESVTAKTRRQRERAANEVEDIVDAEFENLLDQYKRKRADQVISAMYESAERVKASELQTALGKLDLDEDEEAIVESMADAIVSQLLAAPTSSLRDAAAEDDWSTIQTALRLFDPNFGPEDDVPPSFVAGMSPDEIPPEMREEMPTAVLEQLDD
ncbi:glutamyl-tRNA reductase [Salinibaculum rarum]|uniref:glutamyl-tRNA reductase n=1 Tax=Salinibaculum rarum TaxID=3058903 RepID=UPI00265FB3B7|nr:glutamyl-tRNA reductase [Salinibaculum sp. KK48]